MTFSRSDFPAGFQFGAATAAYQIEGHSFGGAGSTHWDTFSKAPGNVVRAEDGAVACDHYHRFAEDLDLLKDAGMDAYRFSTSWARVLPDGRGTPNPEGLGATGSKTGLYMTQIAKNSLPITCKPHYARSKTAQM